MIHGKRRGREAHVGSQFAGTIKLNFINGILRSVRCGGSFEREAADSKSAPIIFRTMGAAHPSDKGRRPGLQSRSRHCLVGFALMASNGIFFLFCMPGELEPELSHIYPVVLICAGRSFPGKHQRVRCIFAVLP